MSDDHTYFILIVREDKIPTKKGPFHKREQVTQYLKELPPHYPGATLIVAEIPPLVDSTPHDMWLTSAEEWLSFDEICKMPHEDDDEFYDEDDFN